MILATRQTAMRAAGSRRSSWRVTLLVESAQCRRRNAVIDYVMIETWGFFGSVESLAVTKNQRIVCPCTRRCGWSCGGGRVGLRRLRYLWHSGRIGGWRCRRCGRELLICQYQFLYCHVLVQVLKTMVCALVRIVACIGLYLSCIWLCWDRIGECVAVSISTY